MVFYLPELVYGQKLFFVIQFRLYSLACTFKSNMSEVRQRMNEEKKNEIIRIKITKIPKSIAKLIEHDNARVIVGIQLQNVELDDTNNATVTMLEITTRLLEKHYMQAQVEFAKCGLENPTIVLLPDEYRKV